VVRGVVRCMLRDARVPATATSSKIREISNIVVGVNRNFIKVSTQNGLIFNLFSDM
jgi:hypothetical protein